LNAFGLVVKEYHRKNSESNTLGLDEVIFLIIIASESVAVFLGGAGLDVPVHPRP
jgi:hypothetical protein